MGKWTDSLPEDEALDLLAEVVGQACDDGSGELDSMGLRSYAGALRFLASKGLVIIVGGSGRRVIGEWATQL